MHDYCGNPLPELPGYAANNVADLFESAASLTAQGGITPDPHPLYGAGRHDLLNLAGRLTDAGEKANTYRSVCVVMVDGLGESLLRTYGSYAPFLKNALSLGPLHSAVPSTTVASHTCLS